MYLRAISFLAVTSLTAFSQSGQTLTGTVDPDYSWRAITPNVTFLARCQIRRTLKSWHCRLDKEI